MTGIAKHTASGSLKNIGSAEVSPKGGEQAMTMRHCSLPMLAALLLPAVSVMAQTINPTQPGATSDPIPSAQTRSLFRPMTPSQPGQDLGAEAAAGLEATMQPGVDAVTTSEVGLGGTDSAGNVPAFDGKGVMEAQRRLWRIRPKASVSMTYDDNIFITNTNRVSDIIWAVTGGLAFELGDFRNMKENFLIAEWYGTGYFYTKNTQQNAFNQSAALLGQYRWNKLTSQLDSKYQYLTGPDRQVGSFANRHVINNALRFNYDYSAKTSFDSEFLQNTQIFQSYFNQYDYRLKMGGEYRVLPKVKIGAEGVAGILSVEESPLQFYQQFRLRAKHETTGKLSFKASGGIEFREFENFDDFDIQPVFSLGAEYLPFDGTLVSLKGYRDAVGSNSLRGQNYMATGFEISIQQRLLQKFYTAVAFGYENDTYYATAPDVDASRVDNYVFVRPSLNYKFLEYMNAGVFYEYRNNVSNEGTNSFYDNRCGVELTCTF